MNSTYHGQKVESDPLPPEAKVLQPQLDDEEDNFDEEDNYNEDSEEDNEE